MALTIQQVSEVAYLSTRQVLGNVLLSVWVLASLSLNKPLKIALLSDYLNKFKDKRFHYFGKKLIYQEKPDLLPKEDYDEIHSTILKRVLSTTDDKKWNTIPRTYKEIDDLRAKFEKSKEADKLKMLEEINAYVEELEKVYSRA